MPTWPLWSTLLLLAASPLLAAVGALGLCAAGRCERRSASRWKRVGLEGCFLISELAAVGVFSTGITASLLLVHLCGLPLALALPLYVLAPAATLLLDFAVFLMIGARWFPDDGGGGGAGDEAPEPEPPWWPQFERELDSYRERQFEPVG